MKLPAAEFREAFYWEVVQKCLVSRGDRKAQYDRLRSYFLQGSSPEGGPADFNKIGSSIDQLTSFLFAADTTRFSLKLGAGVDKKVELAKVPCMMERLHDKWHDSDADIVFGLALTWALVKNTTLVKVIQRGKETLPYMVEPECFGVLREDVTMLDRQEAFVLTFMTTKDQLHRDLEGHPKKEELLLRLSASRRDDNAELPAGLSRIITPLTSFYPTTQGNAPFAPSSNADLYVPRSSEELVEMYELWVWNDNADGPYNPEMGKHGDYQVVTIADPSICIYDRPAGRDMFIPGEHPFTAVTPNPAPDYFWGYSEVEKVIRLQDLREKHMHQVDELVDRNVNPPKSVNGLWGAVDEKSVALQRLNALVSAQDPMAKIQEFKPQIPTDLWQVIDKIDLQFDEAMALNNVLKGKGDAGVRSKGQTDRLAQLGSSRPKKRALIIEDSLERLATLYLKLDQKHNPDSLYTEAGMKFIAEQFTKDYIVKVDGHSSSPVFIEDQKNAIYSMFDRQIVDGDAVLDVEQPQNVQGLKQNYRKMRAARAEAEKRQQAMEAAEAQGKLARING